MYNNKKLHTSSRFARLRAVSQLSTFFLNTLYICFVKFDFVSCIDVRLSGSNKSSNGRVEIYDREFGWGTVCDHSWDIHDGDVVCRVLGFPGAKEVRFAAYYGKGSGPILLDDVSCKGDESHLLDCVHSGMNKHNCSHEDDAGVDCNG